MKYEKGIEVILQPKRLHELAAQLGMRRNWHEPDEQEVDIEFVKGHGFDNAVCDYSPSTLDERPWDHGVFIKHKGKRIAFVNMALLLAWAGWDGSRNGENTQTAMP